MKVVNSVGKDLAKKEIKDQIGFLLLNGRGGYFSRHYPKTSRYDGFFIFENGKMFKIIEEIKSNGIKSVKNNISSIEVNSRKFFMGNNSLVVTGGGKLKLVLDVRESYDSREWGREYQFIEDSDGLVIKYTKKTDNREDRSHDEREYDMYIFIKCSKYNIIQNWENRSYDLDKERQSPPYFKYVFYAANLEGEKIVISAAMDLKAAKRNAGKAEKSGEKPILVKQFKNKEISIAYNCAVNSLNGLKIGKGILAGLPWFFQYWTRDQGISLKALMLMEKEKFAKEILMGLVEKVEEDGRIPNRFPLTESGCADGVGWIFKRCSEFLFESKKGLNGKETELIIKNLKKSIGNMNKEYLREGLIWNNAKETWMDTEFAGDNREGYRIEIQAMALQMYKLAYELTKDKKYKIIESKLKEKVLKEFWNGKILADGKSDFTIRPNVFIAAYIYPQLLKKREWEKCFANALEKLWNDWGGISTIDRENELFTGYHSGEVVKSYHRGDSWFWLNNLAAIIMNRVNAKKFKKYIEAIIAASTEDILFKGVVGHASELSSSVLQKGEGCWAQAWSDALFIEMVEEIYG